MVKAPAFARLAHSKFCRVSRNCDTEERQRHFQKVKTKAVTLPAFCSLIASRCRTATLSTVCRDSSYLARCSSTVVPCQTTRCLLEGIFERWRLGLKMSVSRESDSSRPTTKMSRLAFWDNNLGPA